METEILVLVDDYEYNLEKGVISLLHINRKTMEIISRKVLLELSIHLSFPNSAPFSNKCIASLTFGSNIPSMPSA